MIIYVLSTILIIVYSLWFGLFKLLNGTYSFKEALILNVLVTFFPVTNTLCCIIYTYMLIKNGNFF